MISDKLVVVGAIRMQSRDNQSAKHSVTSPDWRFTSRIIRRSVNSHLITPHLGPARRGGSSTRRYGMSEEQSRVGEYLSRAASLRELADKTRYPEVRERLLGLAAIFERLADQVEKWESERLAKVAD